MTVYRPSLRYVVFALAALVMVALIRWDLTRRVEVGTMLFFGVSLGLVLWNVRAALTRVTLMPDRVVLHVPLAQERTVEFRQLLSVTEEGRLSHAILVAYHPHAGNGLLDLEDVQNPALPTLQGQE